MLQDQRQVGLHEARDLVAVDSMTVHHAQHPEVLYSGEILLVEVRILVNLSHLRDESRSRFVDDAFYY